MDDWRSRAVPVTLPDVATDEQNSPAGIPISEPSDVQAPSDGGWRSRAVPVAAAPTPQPAPVDVPAAPPKADGGWRSRAVPVAGIPAAAAAPTPTAPQSSLWDDVNAYVGRPEDSAIAQRVKQAGQVAETAGKGVVSGMSGIASGLSRAAILHIRSEAENLGNQKLINYANQQLREIDAFEQNMGGVTPDLNSIHDIPSAANYAAGVAGQAVPVMVEYAIGGVPLLVAQGAASGGARAYDKTQGDLVSTAAGAAIEGGINAIPGHLISGAAGKPIVQSAARSAAGMAVIGAATPFANPIPEAIHTGEYKAPTPEQVLESTASSALTGGFLGAAGSRLHDNPSYQSMFGDLRWKNGQSPQEDVQKLLPAPPQDNAQTSETYPSGSPSAPGGEPVHPTEGVTIPSQPVAGDFKPKFDIQTMTFGVVDKEGNFVKTGMNDFMAAIAHSDAMNAASTPTPPSGVEGVSPQGLNPTPPAPQPVGRDAVAAMLDPNKSMDDVRAAIEAAQQVAAPPPAFEQVPLEGYGNNSQNPSYDINQVEQAGSAAASKVGLPPTGSKISFIGPSGEIQQGIVQAYGVVQGSGQLDGSRMRILRDDGVEVWPQVDAAQPKIMQNTHIARPITKIEAEMASAPSDKLLEIINNGKNVRRAAAAQKEYQSRFPDHHEGDIAGHAVETAVQDVDTSPTEAQKEAGNFQKGHVTVHGMDIAIENPRGSDRTGIDRTGKPWSVEMPDHYGYINRTEGADGEQVDVYVGQDLNSQNVFIVDQVNPHTKDFDEHKVMIGYPDQQSAIDAYQRAFSDGNGGARVGAITSMTVDQFKKWLKSDQTGKPTAYKKPEEPKDEKLYFQTQTEEEKNIPTPDSYAVDKPYEPQKFITVKEKRKVSDPNRPLSVLEFIAKNGGIKDEGGDLKAMDAHRHFVPRYGRLVRPAGVTLDNMGLKLHQAGYFGPYNTTARPSTNDVLNMIDEALHGKKITSDDHAVEQAEIDDKKKAEQEHDHLVYHAELLGVETKGLDRDQIVDAVNKFEEVDQEISALHDDFDDEEEVMRRPYVEGLSPYKEPGYDFPIPFEASEATNAPDAGSSAGSKSEGENPPASPENPPSDSKPAAEPTTEPVKIEGKTYDQGVMPGMQQSAKQAAAAYDAQGHGRATTKTPQKRADEGLFDTASRDQTDFIGLPPLADDREAHRLENIKKMQEVEKPAEKAYDEPHEQKPATTGAASDRALEGVSPEDVRPDEESGNAGKPSVERSGTDDGRPVSIDGTGDTAAVSLGDGAREIPIPTRGAGSDAGAEDIGGLSPSSPSEQNAEWDRAGGHLNLAVDHVPAKHDYQITDLTKLGEGGQKTKFKQNIAAIKLLKNLEETNRQATPEEQDMLARYVGWGGLSQAFDSEHKDWTKEYSDLKSVLTPEEYDAARQSTQYAHYTSQQVIQEGIYAAITRMGFTGGKILEPGSGVGNFIGLIPAGIRSGTRFTGVEREKIAAGIARQLYPNQNIQNADFSVFQADDNSFDATVGNPPFGSTSLVDQSGRKHLSGLSIHNYFIAKSLDMTRPNGIVAVVVSNYFLDAGKDTARTYISERARLVGAIRLPNNAFSKNANTEVTTDLIFLQKLPEDQIGKGNAKEWLTTKTIPDPLGGEPMQVNKYFADHPEMMLGRMERAGTMYAGGTPALIQTGDTATMLKAAVEKLPENIYQPVVVENTKKMEASLVEKLDKPPVQEGGYFVKEGKLYQRTNDEAGEPRAEIITPGTQWSEKQIVGPARFQKLVDLANLRQTVRDLIVAESTDGKDMTRLRKLLNTQYDSYVKKNGYLNERGNTQLFSDDPDFPLLAALEYNFDPGMTKAVADKTGVTPVAPKAEKAPIFSRRVIEKREDITKADTPEDALAISLAERGKIDADYVGKLLNRDGDEVLYEMTKGENPDLFVDPSNQEYVPRDLYLSGNVRKKMAEAQAAGYIDNAQALSKVIPEDIPSHEIVGRIGANWITESTYEDFAKELLGEGTMARVRNVAANNSYLTHFEPGSSVSNTVTYGIPKKPATDIYKALLNKKEIKVGETNKDGKFILDKEKTDEANDKAKNITDKFGDWLFSDSDRSEKLGRIYNDLMNNYVTWKPDGSHMTFPGKVPDSIITFRRHQRDAIYRGVITRTMLLDHVVGSGKTYTIIAIAMELKRTGLAKKSMIAVPNHLVKQWATDFYRLYPGANILTATKKDFQKENRKKFLAKIATGDWDAVIIAHSSFGFIKPDPAFEEKFNQQTITEIMQSIEQLKGDNDKDSKRTIKQLEKKKESLEQRIKSLREKGRDDLLHFGEIGVDQLFVDEAHQFKNLMFVTKMNNVRGLGQASGSKRAYDMLIKTRQLMEKNGKGQGVIFATGTPVSNSLAEMYHMMRYLNPQALHEMGHDTFDAWADTFAATEQVWMQALSGDGYKASNRMGTFVNTPELLKIYDQVADTVTMDDIKKAYSEENKGAEFPLPKLKGDKRQPVSIPKSEEQSAYMQEIAERAKVLSGKPEKGKDNMLTILSDARKAAMDIRLVRPNIIERDPNGRIAVAAQNIVERYKKYDKHKGTQLVFSDMGTPLKSVKKELEEYLELKALADQMNDEDLRAKADLGNEDAQAKLDKAEDAANKIEEKGQDWLDAIKAAERGFSIYDDLKKALIEKGLPENEIAFIHDYHTDDQKAALFRAVNHGKIRVLLGSTAKMGAGTNVQERLVALHHIDVPWKPSDVEQREGRIVRQGNQLMHDIKNFEVEVMAYATQDTLDLFMWQTQEKKLATIGQLRTRKVGREVENSFENMQMSAGEMQAAATSNPYLLEEIQLKDQIKKLERQKKSFDAQKNDIISRKKKAMQDIESLPAQIKKAEVRSAATKDYIKSIDDRFDDFSVKINGKEYKSVDSAQEMIQQLTADEPVAKGEKPEPKKIKIDLNGTEYTAMTPLADAWREVVGDKSPILYKLDGKVFNRRHAVVERIESKIATLLKSNGVIEIGSIGKYQISAESYVGNSGRFIHVSAIVDGDEVSNQIAISSSDLFTAPAVSKSIITMAERMVMGEEKAADRLIYRLDESKRAIKDIDAKNLDEKWPDSQKLTDMRQKHADIIKKLSSTGDKSVADVGAIDIDKTHVPEAEAPKFSLDTAEIKDFELEKMKRAIAVRLKQLGWENIPLVLHNGKLTFQGNKIGAAYFNKTIYLAMKSDPLSNLDHEFLHALYDAGAFTAGEWRILQAQAGKWRKKFDIDRRYKEQDPNISEAILDEEGIAHAFQKPEAADQPWFKRIYNRITKFLEAIRNAMNGLGFKTADDVFKDIREGNIAPRVAEMENTAPDKMAARLSLEDYETKPEEPKTPEKLGDKIAARIPENAQEFMAELWSDIKNFATPMANGSDMARHLANNFIRTDRASKYMRDKMFDELTKKYKPEQLKNMWNAMDETSVHVQKEMANFQGREGVPPLSHDELVKSVIFKEAKEKGIGIYALPDDQRAILEALSIRGDIIFQKAKELGMVRGEGIPFWTPRMAAIMGEKGKINDASKTGGGPKNINPIGGNLRTSAGSLKQRKYVTAEETEEAMKKLFGEDAALVRDIRVMPIAIARVEQAVAGRRLIDNIRQYGKVAGIETTSEKPQDGFFTIDHPSFKTWQPKLEFIADKDIGQGKLELDEDGKPREGRWKVIKDSHGNPVMEQVPIYVAREFEGPLRAVLTTRAGAVYSGLMAIKNKSIGMIMYSPFMHGIRIWGKAIPAMPGKVTTGRIYFEGYAARKNDATMLQAIKDGLDPIGSRRWAQDLGILTDPKLKPGRSLTARAIGALISRVDGGAAESFKRGIDQFGNFWHNTLLWDRIGDLQMGLYINFKQAMMKDGFTEKEAGNIAAHIANRYAGIVPSENMGQTATRLSNVFMFSRSYTLGNLAAIKDMIVGLPSHIQSEILLETGKEGLKKANSFARRKAIGMIALDIGLMYLANSLMQDALKMMLSDSSLTDVAKGYIRRMGNLLTNTMEHPSDLLNPFYIFDHISSTYDNEPGKQDRVLLRTDPRTGTAQYVRVPIGAVGEEFKNWLTQPLERIKAKESTLIKPVQDVLFNSDFRGKPIYNPDAKGTYETLQSVGAAMWHIIEGQIPTDAIKDVYRLLAGKGQDDHTLNVLKVALPIAGVTLSKGYPGGPEGKLEFDARQRQEFERQKALPGIRQDIIDGDMDSAREAMGKLGMSPRSQMNMIQKTTNPRAAIIKNIKTFNKKATPEELQQMDQLRRGKEE